MLKMEVEASCGPAIPQDRKPIDPHHLSAALVHLDATGHLVKTVQKTRGQVGRVTVYEDAND